ALGALVVPSAYLPALGLSLVAWGIQSVTVWLLAQAFPEFAISLVDGIVAYSAPLLAGALALVPGGLGATEASMAGMLVVLAGSSSALSVAAALTVLVRLVTFWLAVIVGLVALGAWRLRRARVARARGSDSVRPPPRASHASLPPPTPQDRASPPAPRPPPPSTPLVDPAIDSVGRASGRHEVGARPRRQRHAHNRANSSAPPKR